MNRAFRGLGLVFAALLLVGTSPTTPAGAAPPPGNGYRAHIKVAASQQWTDTGIDVTAGSRVSIESYGTIKIAGSDPGKTPAAEGASGANGTGCTAGPGWVAAGLYCWTMIGKISDAGKPFEVDYGLTVNPVKSGRLFLGVNDEKNSFGDNSGSWTAEVWATTNNCPTIFFFGVRGSGETNDTAGGGYGTPLAAHRYYLQNRFGDSFEPAFIDYAAVPLNQLVTAIKGYKPSVAEGVSALALQMILRSPACPQAKVALAGYSQGANVIDDYLDFATGSKAHSTFLTRIKDATLYGDPRHSNKVLGFERWFNISSNPGGFAPWLYQGIAPALGVETQFTTNPVGDALRSVCDLTFDKPNGTPTLDPICGIPTNLKPLLAGSFASLNIQGRHDQYQKVVPTAVKDSIAHLGG